ncbi:MAG: DUF3991 and TOPRIM domain-containing protein [Pirellulaceae bacterium]
MSLPDRADELEQFKTQIDLCDFACAWAGFTKDRRKSSKSSAILRHTNGDKLIVARTNQRHHIYFNVHNGRDRGTIIDFVQVRERATIGDIRKLLRPYVGRSIELPDGQTPTALSLVPSSFDVAAVQTKWHSASPLPPVHRYLERERRISRSILNDPKLKDRIRSDQRGNAIFPHFSNEGLCGFEVKNRGWTGFSPGGVKGCWITRPHPEDQELLIFETAIDALSLASLEGTRHRRFISTAGQVSPLQLDLLRSAVKKMPPQSNILLCMDNDDGGDQLMAALRNALAPYSQRITEYRPPQRGQDWNDVLRNREAAVTISPKPEQRIG